MSHFADFNTIFSQIQRTVTQLDDKILESKDISVKLYTQFKLDPPQLSPKEKTQLSVGEEKVMVYDQPKGCSPGQTLYYALFVRPIEGSYDLFKLLLQKHAWSSSFYHHDQKIFFKEISTQKIIGDKILAEKISIKANLQFQAIIQILAEFQKEVDDFNTQLNDDISKTINAEITKRKEEKAAKEDLKSFL